MLVVSGELFAFCASRHGHLVFDDTVAGGDEQNATSDSKVMKVPYYKGRTVREERLRPEGVAKARERSLRPRKFEKIRENLRKFEKII